MKVALKGMASLKVIVKAAAKGMASMMFVLAVGVDIRMMDEMGELAT